MSDIIIQVLILCATGVLAGFLGSVMGIGGALITTPMLTVFFNIDIKYAITAGTIVVIATSSGSSIAYLKDHILNLRAAMFLEIFTAIGGLIGALIVGIIVPQVLYVVYACFIVFSCGNMIKKLVSSAKKKVSEEILTPEKSSKTAQKLNLPSVYYDPSTKEKVKYGVTNVFAGSAIMLFAGLASGVLGIGSGIFKVLAMDGAMKMPIKVSTSTSNLMMGVTACASALVYFFGGKILPYVAAPLALGVVVGSTIGARVMPHLPVKIIRIALIPLLLIVCFQMVFKAFCF